MAYFRLVEEEMKRWEWGPVMVYGAEGALAPIFMVVLGGNSGGGFLACKNLDLSYKWDMGFLFFITYILNKLTMADYTKLRDKQFFSTYSLEPPINIIATPPPTLTIVQGHI